MREGIEDRRLPLPSGAGELPGRLAMGIVIELCALGWGSWFFVWDWRCRRKPGEQEWTDGRAGDQDISTWAGSTVSIAVQIDIHTLEGSP